MNLVLRQEILLALTAGLTEQEESVFKMGPTPFVVSGDYEARPFADYIVSPAHLTLVPSTDAQITQPRLIAFVYDQACVLHIFNKGDLHLWLPTDATKWFVILPFTDKHEVGSSNDLYIATYDPLGSPGPPVTVRGVLLTDKSGTKPG